MLQPPSALASYSSSLWRYVPRSTPEDARMGPPDQVGVVTPLVVPEIVTLTAVASGHDHVRVWSSRWLSVVTTPAEVGSGNAQEVWVALADACVRHPVTIADMTGTIVCGQDAVTVLLMALRCTDASGGELWLAVSDAVDRLLSATAISGALPMFRRLHDALASLSVRRPDLA